MQRNSKLNRLRRNRSLESLESRTLLTGIVISEFMAASSNEHGLKDSFGAASDWIELQNQSAENVNLQGWSLGDGGATSVLPDRELGAGEFLVVFATGQNLVTEAGEIHTNFRLRSRGEKLSLVDPEGVATTFFNPYPRQLEDVSYGQSESGFYQYFAEPTPGEVNPPTSNIVINEIMASNQGSHADEEGDFADWIEIFNAGSTAQHMGGWSLRNDGFTWEFPDMTLDAGELQVIFASGNNRRDPERTLHTNFRLSGFGESLQLRRDDGRIVSELNFGQQRDDISYGLATNLSEYIFFDDSTPGQPNVSDFNGVRFSRPSGYYFDATTVELTTELEEAQIRYTVDGSVPTLSNGLDYESPIEVNSSLNIRAAAFANGVSSEVSGSSYVFRNSIWNQTGAGLPNTWGAVADYAFDPDDVVNFEVSFIPMVSLVGDIDDWFGIQTGIIANPMLSGEAWDRTMSVGFANPFTARHKGLDFNATVRTAGSEADRNPALTPKFGFEVELTAPHDRESAATRLFSESNNDQHQGFILRANQSDSWMATTPEQHARPSFVRNEWLLRTQAAMDQPAFAVQQVNLFINDLYWGVYDMVERPDAATVADKLDADPNDVEIIGANGPIVGSDVKWGQLLALANDDLADSENFDKISRLVDIDNLIDFAILNRFANVDLFGESWVAVRSTNGDERFRFMNTYNESAFTAHDDQAEPTQTLSEPETLLNRLTSNPNFKRRFGDRLNLYVANNAALSSESNNRRITNSIANLNSALEAEVGRWGDYRREVNPIGNEPYRVARMSDLDDGIAQLGVAIFERSESFIQEMQDSGLLPTIEAPSFSASSGRIASDRIFLQASAGVIFFTLDGSDPLSEEGRPSENAIVYSSNVAIDSALQIRARARVGDTWSPISEGFFAPAQPEPIRVTEIMYHPGPVQDGANFDDDDFEFIELTNFGGETMSLDLLRFRKGISFNFADGDVHTLEPNQSVVVVKNLEAFSTRYSTDEILIAGEYSGNLNNGGEEFLLSDQFRNTVERIVYQDFLPLTDGVGYSLVRDINNIADALANDAVWQASFTLGGSPGEEENGLAPNSVVINEVMSNTNGQLGDWIEIHNTTDETIDLGDWYLSDDATALRKYRIPTGQTIAPGGYVILTATEHFSNENNPNAQETFSISRRGESIFLSSGDDDGRLGGYRNSFRLDAAELNVTYGRFPKADGTVDFTPLTTATLGSENSAPRVGPIVISEVMFSPLAGFEYIELQNISNAEVKLFDESDPEFTWEFQDGVSFSFPEGTRVGAGDRLLVTRGLPDQFRAIVPNVPANVQVFGPFSGALRNEGEGIRLYRPYVVAGEAEISFSLVDHVRYDNENPWPQLVNGQGSSLERRDLTMYGNDPNNWGASQLNGTAGRANRLVDQFAQSSPYSVDLAQRFLQDLDGWSFSSSGLAGWFINNWQRPSLDSHAAASCTGCSAGTNEAIVQLDVSQLTNPAIVFQADFLNHNDSLELFVSQDRFEWTPIVEGTLPATESARFAMNLGATLQAAEIDQDQPIFVKIAHSSFQASTLSIPSFSVLDADLFGPWIDDYQTSGPNPTTVNKISLQFNEPIGSLETSDVSVSTPVGEVIEIQRIRQIDQLNWDIELPNQDLPGEYQVMVHSSVTDLNGNGLSSLPFGMTPSAQATREFSDTFTIVSDQQIQFPYETGFEVEQFPRFDGWTFFAGGGSWSSTSDADPATGQFHLVAESKIDRGPQQEAILRLDMSQVDDENQVSLAFDVKRDGESNFGELSISNDGERWHRVYAFQPDLGGYRSLAFDLDDAISNYGLSLDEPLFARLSHSSEFAGERLFFDNMQVNSRDTQGPIIESLQAAGDGSFLSEFSLRFNEKIATATFDKTDDVVLRGPTGQRIPISSITTDDQETFVLSIPRQELGGEYRLAILPGMQDLSGIPLNQDNDPVAGENSAEDGFFGAMSVRTSGTQSYPIVESFDGDLGQLDSWSFSVDSSSAWNLSPNENGGRSLVTETGANGGTAQFFFAVDLSEQAESDNLFLNLLASRERHRDSARLYIGDDGEKWSWVSDLSANNSVVMHSFDLDEVIARNEIEFDSHVYVRIDFQSSSTGRFELERVEVSDIDRIGPRIDFAIAEETNESTLLSVRFNEPIDEATFTAEDVKFELSGSPLEASSIEKTGARDFLITFPRSGAAGSYDLTIGPDVRDLSGSPMNQNRDAISGVSKDDSYSTVVDVSVTPQSIPYFQDFESGGLSDLSGWQFRTQRQFASELEAGRWSVSSRLNPIDENHLRTTQAGGDCWSEYSAVLTVDMRPLSGATNLVLDFYAQRATSGRNDWGIPGDRNMVKLLIGENSSEMTQVGTVDDLLRDDGTQRFADLDEDSTPDLVPTVNEYVRYQFDLDKMITGAGLVVDGLLRINFHQLGFFNEDVVTFDNVRIYQDGASPGDANRDGIFNSRDLVLVFQAGHYEDDIIGNSTWETGDWTGDGEFTTADLVAAFQAGNYSNAVGIDKTNLAENDRSDSLQAFGSRDVDQSLDHNRFDASLQVAEDLLAALIEDVHERDQRAFIA